MTHRIAVLQRALENVADDFHVLVRMGAEAHAGHDEVVVDDPQRAKTEPLRVVIVRETERVVAVQPAVFGMAAFICFSNYHHGPTLPRRVILENTLFLA